MDDMIIFSKTRLAELENKIVEWDAEVLKLKRQQQDLKREYSLLLAQHSTKVKEFQSLQHKYSETQIRKFGKLIVLEDLDKIVTSGQGTEDLRNKLRVQEAENASELREIKKDISNVESEVLSLTEAHTTCLNELLSLRSVEV
jgi:chromosome segregation ATPase